MLPNRNNRESRFADWTTPLFMRFFPGKRAEDPDFAVPEPPIEPKLPKIGLALSSGGAKGLAHIGVIQVLEENSIPIDMVAGTSMGAYVGACWAGGLDGEGLEVLAAEIKTPRDRLRLIDPVFPPRKGFLKGERIRNRLVRAIGEKDFADLGRKLLVIATEMGTYDSHVFSRGNVADAVHASLAIPGICWPVDIDGRRYVDGGVSNPLPVRALFDAGMDHVIAVSVIPTVEELRARRQEASLIRRTPQGFRKIADFLNRRLNYFAPGNVLDILRSAALGSQIRVAEFNGAMADVYLRPVVCTGSWHDYHHFDQYIAAGRKTAEAHLSRIRALLDEGAVSRPKPANDHLNPSLS